MASQKYLFRGKAVYPKVFKPDEYGGVKRWKIGVALDDDSLLLFKNTGLKLKVADVGEFKNVVNFRRPTEKMINGELVEFDPPKVEGVPDGAAIANGSEVEVVVTVYDTRMGKGHRLESVNVTKLVEYEGETEQRPAIITPEDIKKTGAKGKSTKDSGDINDAVPF